MTLNNDHFFSYSSTSISSSSSSQLSTPRLSSPQAIASNEELRKEITELDIQIFELEQHLLFLYRTSFEDQLPKLLLDHAPSIRGKTSLADLLGLNTPNKLSEEILRLICMIVFRLSDKRRSRLVKNSAFEQELGVVVHKLCLDEDNLKSVESMIHNFKSLVQKLEKVDPAKMAQEEKLAFWINIHNALVMHAYIVYGMCEGTTSTMIFKATFNIGGEQVNAHDIQSWILGIRASHSGSHLRALVSPARSAKISSGGHTYAVGYIESLLHFALSTGTSTDPMVRVYTTEGIFQELKQAREGFIRTSVKLEKETRILLPKIMYNYAKDASLDMTGLFNIISKCLTTTKRDTMRRFVNKKLKRGIHWINQDVNFRYIIDCDIVKDSYGV